MHGQGWGKIYRCIVQGVFHKLSDTFLSPEAIKMLISGLGAAVAYLKSPQELQLIPKMIQIQISTKDKINFK